MEKQAEGKYVFLNGRMVPRAGASVSVFDNGFLYGDGVYETLRTYGGRVWQLQKHLTRLEKSAAALSLKLPVNKETIGGQVEKLVKKNGFPESRIRITLTRGVNGFDFATCRRPTLLIAADRLNSQPAAVYAKGVNVISVRVTRVLPAAKTISLLPFIAAQQKMARVKAYEALFVDEKGYVREGTVTNVFAVKKGTVYTPKTGILRGTTRDFLLKIMKKNGIRCVAEDFTLRKLYSADEIFITNAPRGIVPVARIDGRKTGRGAPGPVTQNIMGIFKAAIYNGKKTYKQG